MKVTMFFFSEIAEAAGEKKKKKTEKSRIREGECAAESRTRSYKHFVVDGERPGVAPTAKQAPCSHLTSWRGVAAHTPISRRRSDEGRSFSRR